jgi:hypothetical protein
VIAAAGCPCDRHLKLFKACPYFVLGERCSQFSFCLHPIALMAGNQILLLKVLLLIMSASSNRSSL